MSFSKMFRNLLAILLYFTLYTVSLIISSPLLPTPSRPSLFPLPSTFIAYWLQLVLSLTHGCRVIQENRLSWPQESLTAKGVDLCESPSHYAGCFTGLVLCRSCAGNCNLCKFIITMNPMYLEDTVLQLFSWKPGSHTLSMPTSIMCSAPFGVELLHRCLI